jgi:hypothetical protein
MLLARAAGYAILCCFLLHADEKRAAHRKARSSIVRISFIKSGGFAGPMTRVEGRIDLSGDHGSISGDGSYHRDLSTTEVQDLRVGAQPQLVTKAASTLAAATSGMADVEQYNLRIRTEDGKDHDAVLPAPADAEELQDVPPQTAKFLMWLQQQAQQILTEKFKSR